MIINCLLLILPGIFHLFLAPQAPFVDVTLDDFSSDNLIIKGTYHDIVSSYGTPQKEVEIAYVLKNQGHKDTIDLTYIAYKDHSYVRFKDSVQLYFVDLKRSHFNICLKGLLLNAKTKAPALLWHLHSQRVIDATVPEDELFSYIEGHYCTYKKVKVLNLPNPLYKYDCISICFSNSFFDKKLWYIEFPIVIKNGIICCKIRLL